MESSSPCRRLVDYMFTLHNAALAANNYEVCKRIHALLTTAMGIRFLLQLKKDLDPDDLDFFPELQRRSIGISQALSDLLQNVHICTSVLDERVRQLTADNVLEEDVTQDIEYYCIVFGITIERLLEMSISETDTFSLLQESTWVGTLVFPILASGGDYDRYRLSEPQSEHTSKAP